MAIDKLHPKIIERSKRRQKTQHNTEGEKKSQRTETTQLQALAKATVIRTVLYWGRIHRQINGSRQRTRK